MKRYRRRLRTIDLRGITDAERIPGGIVVTGFPPKTYIVVRIDEKHGVAVLRRLDDLE